MSARFGSAALAAAWVLGCGMAPAALSAELMTLFTTPEERQVINANRYKSDEIRTESPDPVEAPAQILVREQVTRQYRISGISLSADGAHTAWINSIAYDDGARLDDGSRLQILPGEQVRVRIVAPDGSDHYGLSGETVEVTYLAPIED